MRYSNVDFNIVYVDPSRGTDGDGTTPAMSKKNLPSTAADFQNNTCYIIRRTAESSACTVPNGTNNNLTNLLIMGMPNASDEMYELVPAAAKTACWALDEAGARKSVVPVSDVDGRASVVIGPNYQTVWYEIEVKE